MDKLETMEDMAKRLHGTGGGEQAKAVIRAIQTITQAHGILDANNSVTALYYLSKAVSGEFRAVDTILRAAAMFENQDHII